MNTNPVSIIKTCVVLNPHLQRNDEKYKAVWEPSLTQTHNPAPPQLRIVEPAGKPSNPRSRSFDTLRGIKVILLLVGLALCLVVMKTSPEWDAILALQYPIESIVLYPTKEIQVSSEMVFPQVHMMTSPGFKTITNNTHIWAYMQTVDVGSRSGLVYYFKFQGPVDANMSLERIQASSDFTTTHEARQFGQYTVLVIVTCECGNPSPYFEAVFGQIGENSKA